MCKKKNQSKDKGQDKDVMVLESRRDDLERRVVSLRPRLDVRNNPVEATQRESGFAIDVMGNLSGDNLAEMYAYVSGMWDNIIVMYTRCMEGDLKDSRNRTVLKIKSALAKLPKPTKGDLKSLKFYQSNPSQLTEFFMDGEHQMKKWIDYYTNFYLLAVSEHASSQYEKARKHPAFQDRGRVNAPEEEILKRRDSGKNLKAGIAASEHDDDNEFFSTKVGHAKGFLRRDPDSATSKAFEESGAPFIGGASGSMLSEVTHIEAANGDTGVDDIEDEELANRERILGLKMLSLVCGGHHSLAECLIPVQALGYFKDVTDPISGKGAYNKAMGEFEFKMRSLGVKAKISLAS